MFDETVLFDAIALEETVDDKGAAAFDEDAASLALCRNDVVTSAGNRTTVVAGIGVSDGFCLRGRPLPRRFWPVVETAADDDDAMLAVAVLAVLAVDDALA